MDVLPVQQDDNLKEMAIYKIVEMGCSIEDVSRETGICELTLFNWAYEYCRQSLRNKN